MPSRLSAFVIWALVAASAVFWALRFFARGPEAPASAVPVSVSSQAHGDLDRLLGEDDVPVAAPNGAPAPPSRFRLLGVVAPRAGTPAGEGVAVIAVDDKPPRAYRVGARVEGDLMLRSVSPRSVSLGTASGENAMNLQLPSRLASNSAAPAAAPVVGASRRPPIARPPPDDVPPADEAPPEEDVPPEEPPESDGSVRPED
jgi:general secretion pathway protein C